MIYWYSFIYLLAPSDVYLYTGSGTAGIKSAYESGIMSRILWWYDNLKTRKYLTFILSEFDILLVSIILIYVKSHSNNTVYLKSFIRNMFYLKALSKTSRINFGLGCSTSRCKQESQSSHDQRNWKLLKW